ncbi:hypothetical protein [Evansella cellulosilytica]|uniref:Uncharacterized protein n=1 Tax=Evansella cellulosilytica (strain ATCC 21833 / DSM 2522 / FERM P-1141 / JCM 9156 / N-4) TaxID=649639 RepID=E6TU39_EVAC2|nr:hypothetical protein [Evansella cellulosilytica]ADU28499.1 hypothetical protein Bcell_0211 [Evansella cellulosilytica DSM 2522]
MEKEILINTGVSLSKSALGAVPFVGTLLNEVFFDYRGRLKQQRINTFIEDLKKYLDSHVNERNIDMKYVRSEQFGDLFESIINRVSQNNQKDKIDRFKSVLVNQMIAPYETDYTETFLDIVSKISEKQIEILSVYRKVHEGIIKNEDDLMNRNLLDANHELKTSDFRTPQYYNLDKNIYMFYVQDLVSKSLLLDDSINRFSTRPYEILEITAFGLEFLRFIERK